MKPPLATWPELRAEGRVLRGTPVDRRAPGVGSRPGTWFAAWYRRACDRFELERLDGRLLRDIGLSEEQAAREMAKPFWRA